MSKLYTEEEFDLAMDKLAKTRPYVAFDTGLSKEVCLDGHFTLEQLELVIAQMKSLSSVG